ncbi:hypothetical protein BGZ49_001611 [Haplosporangium sp. Z 27]|nr:hypothetical protein BGZ49_001611 [Haplosporangium sp. Z 27]
MNDVEHGTFIPQRLAKCIIVDSTRKGKRVPDALSKTIPIWCATINNAIRKCALENQQRMQQQQSQQIHCRGISSLPSADTGNLLPSPSPSNGTSTLSDESNEVESSLRVPSLDSERWDTRYHSLPSLISRSEHIQIAEKIDAFAEKLMVGFPMVYDQVSSVTSPPTFIVNKLNLSMSIQRFSDMTPLTTRLLKPIRPIWLTPQSFLFKDDMPDYSQVAFFPVICLSASRVVPEGMEECDGYLYVQGSGDDEEMWSEGLTPDLFWNNEEYLLEEGITSAECERRAREIVQKAKMEQLDTHQHQLGKTLDNGESVKPGKNGGRVLFTPSMELCSEIKPSPFWIGNNASGRIPDCWQNGFDMVINCAAEIQRDPLFEWTEGSQLVSQLGVVGIGGTLASMCIVQRHQWEAVASASPTLEMKIPAANAFSKEYHYLHLPIAEGKKGQHQLLEMIPIAVKAVESLYTSRAKQSDGAETEDLKILIHCQQGMDRSVGITLSLLVSCFDEETSRFLGANTNRPSATKETIQRRLFQIMSYRLAARPSRATLKMVNTYFMSPTDPPPAKHKRQ